MATTMIGKIEGLEEDIAAIKAELEAAIATTMLAMLSRTDAELQESIQHNVYDAFHQNGNKYERRYENYGLIDFDESHGIVSRDVDKNSFYLGYYPQGWSNQSDMDWILDGDELIERIETATPSYDWHGDVPGPRPFLTPLMERLIEGGEYERWFVELINSANPKLEVTEDGGVERDADDWR